MRRLFSLLFAALLLGLSAMAGGVSEYEIEGAGTGAQGTYLVKVSVLTKDKKISNAEIGKCAVHGVLFRGFADQKTKRHQKPLAGSASVESENVDFFKNFFDGGSANDYVGVVSESKSTVKAGKQYRISAIVTVNKEQLRKDLESAGVLRGLNSVF